MVNAERRGKATVELKPISTVMSSFLKITKDRVPGAIYGGRFYFRVYASRHAGQMGITVWYTSGYIKNFQVYDPHRVGRITVELQGMINDCRALTYRQDIKARDIEGYRVRMLPTHQVYELARGSSAPILQPESSEFKLGKG
ncbi:40S ribosomal protein S15a-5-like [Juglans regia]|uniref:40S ribosomal protein S15a-5-like n=1 Tax=Juglans regia TaxID=51240 RepID=A0A6P9EI55_JUGRE|nr:40S ribosomal protein S15a-5-like [Juglans regia]